MRAAICAALLATSAHAEPTEIIAGRGDFGDAVSFEMQAYSGVLTYDNSERQTSSAGDFVIASGGASCGFSVRLGGVDVEGAEIVSVACKPPYTAHPETAHIPDGQVFHFSVELVGF